MRRFLSIGIVLAALTGALLLASGSHAGTTTPTPTPSATATPVFGEFLISVRFVLNGAPVSVYLTSPVTRVLANGHGCPVAVPAIEGFFSGYEIRWPLPPGPSQPEDCTKNPPTLLRFEFLTPAGAPAGELNRFAAEFLWTGGDATYDLDVSFLLTPTPTSTPTAAASASSTATASPGASPTSSPTPKALPDTGGGPGSVGFPLLAPMLFVGGAICVLVSLLLKRR